MKSPQIRDGLRKTLEEDNAPEVLFAAAKVLAGLEDPAGTVALMDVYDRKRKTRSSLLQQKKRSLFEEFHSPHSTLMFILHKGIGYVPLPGAGDGFSAIGELLKDPGLSDRAEVLFVQSRTKSQELPDLLLSPFRFPAPQRFGLVVVAGTIIDILGNLFVLPLLGGAHWKEQSSA